MLGFRKVVVGFFGVVLLFSLLGAAFSSSVNIAFSKPDKIEKWLQESEVYDGFVANAVKQGERSVSNSLDKSDAVQLTHPIIQDAADAAFTPLLLEQAAKTFLDSNYAWLQGKTATPSFVIDFTDAKESFAQNVGSYTEKRLAGLAVCAPAEQAQLASSLTLDLLLVPCRPADVDPAAAGDELTKKLENADGFLGNPIITPQSINPEDKGQSQPYYVKLAKAPQVYQASQKLPLILATTALLSATIIMVVASSKRKGARRVGFMFLVAGITLAATDFIASTASNKFEDKAFNKASNGELERSLADFTDRAQDQLATVNMYFAAAFLLIAVIIFIYLISTRQKVAPPRQQRSQPQQPLPAPQQRPSQSPKPEITLKRPIGRPPASQTTQKPHRPRRPRLIQ